MGASGSRLEGDCARNEVASQSGANKPALSDPEAEKNNEL
jgi:hypothetical protein